MMLQLVGQLGDNAFMQLMQGKEVHVLVAEKACKGSPLMHQQRKGSHMAFQPAVGRKASFDLRAGRIRSLCSMFSTCNIPTRGKDA